MPVNSTHAQYDAAAADWARARDVLAGDDALKAAGERYIPRLDFQTPDEFRAYCLRASFFNATARTAEGYVGLIFRRPPFIKTPPPTLKGPVDGEWLMVDRRNHHAPSNEPSAINNQPSTADPQAPAGGKWQMANGRWQNSNAQHPGTSASPLGAFLNDADMLGGTFAGYAKDVVWEVICVGRCGSLVDWEEEAEQRAYVSLYSAEQILNWRVQRVNGRSVPTLIVLKETTEASDNADEFQPECVDQLRVLKLVPCGSAQDAASDNTARPYQCVVEIWRQSDHQPSTKNHQPRLRSRPEIGWYFGNQKNQGNHASNSL